MTDCKELRIIAKPKHDRRIISGKSDRDHKLEDLVNNAALNHQIKTRLPENYNFNLFQIICKIKENHYERVGLQFPEGLFIFSSTIGDIIEQFTECSVIIIGDVSYGACCIEDYLASITKCDLLIHFAHSCLVPFNAISDDVKVMYVLVDIKIDVWHLTETVKYNFPNVEKEKIVFCATIQFISSIQSIAAELIEQHGYNIIVPQVRPLSRGEVLGCTAPKLDNDTTAVIFVADGRFHLEAVMIANPFIKRFYKYNPYNKEMTSEYYQFDEMIKQRQASISKAAQEIKKGCTVGLILGTLGHQGSPKVLHNLKAKLKTKAPICDYILILLPEIKASTLNQFGESVKVWVQTSCPRLSIDWGNDVTTKPLLNPYEFNLALNCVEGSDSNGILLSKRKDVSLYPMDYYASQSLGDWTPNHKCNKTCSCN